MGKTGNPDPSQGGDPGNPPGGNPPNPPNPQGGAGDGQQNPPAGDQPPDWVKDPAKAYEEIQKLRREAAEHRTKAQQLADAQKAADDAKLVEQGKFKDLADQRAAEVETLKKQLRDNTIDQAVLVEAAKLGFAQPDAAIKLIDRAKVTVGDDGSVAGVLEAVQVVAKSYPGLLGKPTAPNLPPSNPAGGGQTLTREAISKMTPDQINANWDAVQAALAKKE